MRSKYPFPAVAADNCRLFFNPLCEELTKHRYIQVSKVGTLFVFRASENPVGLLWKRGEHQKTGFYTALSVSLKTRGLKDDTEYRLFPYNGGLALDTANPMGGAEDG